MATEILIPFIISLLGIGVQLKLGSMQRRNIRLEHEQQLFRMNIEHKQQMHRLDNEKKREVGEKATAYFMTVSNHSKRMERALLFIQEKISTNELSKMAVDHFKSEMAFYTEDINKLHREETLHTNAVHYHFKLDGIKTIGQQIERLDLPDAVEKYYNIIKQRIDSKSPLTSIEIAARQILLSELTSEITFARNQQAQMSQLRDVIVQQANAE